MLVNRHELKEGCILQEDIFSVSPTPIMLKKTVLASLHLEVLRAFLIEEVEVSETLDNGERFKPMKVIESDTQEKRSKAKQDGESIRSSYNEAIKRFKEQFTQWQGGSPVNLFALQGILLSLLNAYLKKPYELFRLHEKTTEEDYIFHHSVSVGLISVYLAQKMKYPKNISQKIGLAGILMDCGMARIPPHFLFKTKSIDQKAARQLARHPVFGYQMLKKQSSAEEGILFAVLQHHEREDGSGYPLKVTGSQIHPYAKIIMVADTYHAMVSQRHYRKPISPFTALEVLNKDLIKYDTKVLLTLTQEVTQLFVGTQVTLSNNEEGEIIFIPSESPTRPMVRLNAGQAIALSQHPTLLIERLH